MGPLCGLRLGQNASLTLNNNNNKDESLLGTSAILKLGVKPINNGK